ncbi:alpha/beta hydrolase [Nocardia panacis]|uniref:Alpha/beta hydrolase n=1 Tax=Nocardia panacis TaxID=2340916 RepID=A0A3A4KNT2_9NOCA|nr:alpha/beta hydrolase [Nocardia panacis]RJO77027.1 alpha/beta hydrolase [Nocardia panacis]
MTYPLYRDFRTVAELDAQYALYRTVDDFDGYLASYVRRSAETRERLAHREVRFGPTLDESFDLFPARAMGPSPVLIFVHGGYWCRGTKADYSFLAEGAVAHGCAAVIENYALCPYVSLTEIVRQHRALVAYLYTNAESLGLDRDRIYISGHSAGGHAVASVLTTDWSRYGLPADVVKAGIAISGIFDLRPLPHTYLAPELQLTAAETIALSPIFWLPERIAPLVLAYGSAETAELRRQSRDFAQVAEPRAVLELARNHYDILDDLADPDGPLTAELVKFLGR